MLRELKEGYDWDAWGLERIAWELFRASKEYSQVYIKHIPKVHGIREKYKVYAEGWVCVDGRQKLNRHTRTYEGEIWPRRSAGVTLRIGYKAVRKVVDRALITAKESGYDMVIFLSDHYDRTDPTKNCAAMKNDRVKARITVLALRDQILELYQSEPVFPIVVTTETSDEELIFHGDHGVICCADMIGKTEDEVLEKVCEVFISQTPNVKRYLTRCIMGNSVHVQAQANGEKLSIAGRHSEKFLCIGEGFSPVPAHRGLILNPLCPDFSEQLMAGADVLRDHAGKNGFVLLTSAVYRDRRDKPFAVHEARDLMTITLELLKKHRPKTVGLVKPIPVVVNFGTMEMEPIDCELDHANQIITYHPKHASFVENGDMFWREAD